MRYLQTFIGGLLSLCLCSFPNLINGQLLYNGGTTIFIGSDTEVFVDGGIELNKSDDQLGTIQNNGRLILTGDWTNESGSNALEISNGEVILAGEIQTIGGSEMTQFQRLFLEGNETKILESDIGIPGNSAYLDLGNAKLDLNQHRLIIDNGSPLAIRRREGFILAEDSNDLGKISWRIGNQANTYSFPFGNAAGKYLPVTINIVNPGIGSGRFLVSTYPTDANNQPLPVSINNFDINQDGQEDGLLAIDRFWNVLVEGFVMLPPRSDLTFRFDSESDLKPENLFEPENLLGINWQDQGSTWNSPTGLSNDSSFSVMVEGTTSYGIWALVSQNIVSTFIQNELFGSDIDMFPNPFKDELNIHFEASSPFKGRVGIFNMYGQEVKRSDVNSFVGKSSILLSLADLTQGLYFVHLISVDRSQGGIFVGQIMKE